MQNISGAFKQALYYDNRAYIERAVITLVDDTVLTLTNENIWQSGFSVEDAVGASEDSFSALGSAIVNQAKIVINNIYGEFSDYNFNGAKMVLYVGLELPDGDSTRQEMIKKGTYIVDEAVYNGSLITITALDKMMLFDKPYSESLLVYPASADTIIRGACTDCGVSLATLNFPFKETEIAERPNEEATTYREVISYVATICGCFARCNADGRLELKWFDQALLESTMEGGLDGGSFDSSTPYSTGDTADGGSFNPWNTGSAVDGGVFNDTRGLHYISSIYQSNISVDDVVITGIEIEVEIEVDGNKAKDIRKTGTSGYTIQISDNPFITSDNVDTMLSRLGTQLIGLTFRKASLSHSSDPSIEAGDIAIIIDQKNNVYPILITRTAFTAGASQRTVCGASTPARKSAVRFSEQTKSYVELRKEMKEQKSTYEQALEDLAERIDNADGLYETQVPQTGGGVITYMHNKPDLEDSDVQIMISNVGVTVTANGTAQQPTWYGLTVDGQLIASILNTVGVNADWIHSGTLTLGGDGNVNGQMRVLDASGHEIGRWNNSGITASGNLTVTNGRAKLYSGYGYLYSYSVYPSLALRKLLANGIIIENTDSRNTIVQQTTWTDNDGAEVTSVTPNLIYRRVIGTNVQDIGMSTSQTDAIPYMVEEYCGSDNGGEYYTIESNIKNATRDSAKFWLGIGRDGFCAMNGSPRVGSAFTLPSYANNSVNYGASGENKVVVNSNGIGIQGGQYATIYIDQNNQKINNKTISFASSSSKRYKHDITDKIDDALDADKLYELPMKQFVFNDNHLTQYPDMKGQTIPGFIAEDVAEIYPSATIYNSYGEIESWDERRIIPGMLKLIQEQHEEIEKLKAAINNTI